MTEQSPRSRVLIEHINRETEKCLTVLDRLPRPAKRNARELHVVEAKLAAAETEAECQVLRAEKRRLIRESESGLKEAIRDWHSETNDVVEDLVTTFLRPMLREIESHIAKSDRDTPQTDTHSGVDQVASPRTPTMPTTTGSETNQVQESPSVASNILAAEKPAHKRKASPSRPPAPKRQRREREKNTITFAEVFRNGNAPVKRIIVPYPPDHGKWYIIRCRKHNVNFKEHPLKAASRHICQSKHPNMPRDYESVIKMMGYRVVDCDEALAEKNNAVAREAFGIRSQPRSADSIEVGYDTIAPEPARPFHDDGDGDYEEEGNREPTPKTSSSSRRRSFMAITDPTPGEVYQVYWRMLKKWTAAIVLPLENLERFGIEDSIESLGLLKSLPSCYTYDPLAKTFQWSKDYETGGKNVSKREFPVMFFNGSLFPEGSEVAWVPAKDLNPPEICALEPHIQRQVLDFLAAREAGQGRVVEDESEERSIERESEESGIEEGPERTDSGEEENPCQTIQQKTIQQNECFQLPAQTVPMEEEAAEISQPAQNVESGVTAPIVIDLTGEDSSSDEGSDAGRYTASGQKRTVGSAVHEGIAGKQPVAAEVHSRTEPEDRDPSMDTAPSTDSTITDPPTPVLAQSPVAEQEGIFDFQLTASMTPETTLLAQLACRMVDLGDKNIKPQHTSRQVAAEQAMQHTRLERPREAPYITQSSPNIHTDQSPHAMTPAVQNRPHPIPRPQTVGPSPGRLPELRVQTNHQEKSACRLPSIQNLLEGPQMTGLGISQPGRATQSPMMPSSPYTPGSSIPNHLRPNETQTHSTPAMMSPQLTPRATTFRSWNWLSCFTQPVAEQLQLASGSPAPASPRDFMDHLGRLQCPFCKIHVLQLDHFTQHLQHPCRSILVGHASPSMSTVTRGKAGRPCH